MPIALSDKQNNTTLHLNPNSSEGHSIIAKGHTWSSDKHEHIKVKCQTLDAVCRTNDIDKIKLLKIDVEGAHFLVLQGATRMLSQRTIDLIICEAGTNTQHISGRTDKELLTQMIEYGYSNIYQSTLLKWSFEINLEEYEGEFYGSIYATSSDEMNGGEGKMVCFDIETGKFSGYGQQEECY